MHQFVPSLFSQQLDLGASGDSADEGRASPQGQAADRRRPEEASARAAAAPEEGGRARRRPGAAAARKYKPLDGRLQPLSCQQQLVLLPATHQTLCSRLLKITARAQKQLLKARTEKERRSWLKQAAVEGTYPAMEPRLKWQCPSEPPRACPGHQEGRRPAEARRRWGAGSSRCGTPRPSSAGMQEPHPSGQGAARR